MISKQIEKIKELIKTEKEDEQYREVAVHMINEEETINFVVDNKLFKYEVNEGFLYIIYNGDTDEDPIIYSHLIRIDQISHITDEV